MFTCVYMKAAEDGIETVSDEKVKEERQWVNTTLEDLLSTSKLATCTCGSVHFLMKLEG